MQKLALVAPGSVWRYLAAAEAFQSQGDNDAAIIGYRHVLALDPNRPGVHYRLGQTLLARSRQKSSADDLAQALKEFEVELRLDPSNANAAYEIAEAQRNAGHFDEAQQFFERALRYYPDFEEAHLGLAGVLMSLQKPELPLPHLQEATKLKPDDEVAWYRLARAEAALGNGEDQKKALAEFQRLKSQKSIPRRRRSGCFLRMM